MHLYIEKEMPDMEGAYNIMWDTTGKDGVPRGISTRPIDCSAYDEQNIKDGKLRYDKNRTITNRDYYEVWLGTATLTLSTGVIVHHATDIVVK